MAGPLRSWTKAWNAFRSDFPGWPPAEDLDEPLYRLPREVIDRLGRAHDRSAALLSAQDARAERAFADLCRTHHATGCWRGWPVSYRFLNDPLPAPDKGLSRKAGWTPAQFLESKRLARETEDASLRLKGYAGWLLTEPAFLDETRRLSDRWRGLPEPQRPLFPLGRTVQFPTTLSQTELTPEADAFAADVPAFLDRWGLTRLATWELPEPQGPLLPNLLSPEAPALPRHGVHLVLPLHHPLQGDDGLLRRVLDLQRRYAREQGLDDSLAGLPHYKAYAGMFDVLHLERTIRSRLRADHPRRGIVGRMEEAIAAVLGGSLDQVRKFRKAIAACRRGRRARVTWLRPRAR
jgi:hypothetical protein